MKGKGEGDETTHHIALHIEQITPIKNIKAIEIYQNGTQLNA
jgi:hypothetical protein